MNSVEIIALIFASIVIIKAFFIFLIDNKRILKFAKSFYQDRILINAYIIISLFLLGFFLLKHLTIVEIFAASIFGMFLYAFFLVQNSKELWKVAEVMLRDKKKLLLPFLITFILALWVLKELFL